MKKHSAYTIGSLIILLICAFVFVILPAISGSTGKQGDIPSFGKYNGKEIRYEEGSDLQDLVSQYAQMFQSYGQQLDQNTYYTIFNYAFSSTVARMAYTDAVEKSGYKVPKEAINRQLRPYFYDETGKYSSKVYKQAPASEISTLRTSIEKNLISARFYDDNFASQTELFDGFALYGIKHSDKELDFLSDYAANKRGFDMAVFPLSSYPEEEKIAYAEKNADKFNKYDFSVITVTDKSTANTVAKRLANNEITFVDAISEYSEKNYSNTEGKLTFKYQYQIETLLSNKDDMATLKALTFDDVSPVIQTTNGYTIFKSDASMVAADFTNSDTVNAVSSYITTYESSMIEDYFSAKAKDFIAAAKASDFTEACAMYNIEKVEIAPFPMNYGAVSFASSMDTDKTALANGNSNENFLKTAFSLKLNDFSEPLVMNNNIVVLQYTTEETVDGANSVILTDLQNYDEDSASDAIMNSPKLENNFINAYFEYFVN